MDDSGQSSRVEDADNSAPTSALRRFLQALDVGDWDAMRSNYAADAEIIFPGTPVLDVDGVVEVCQHFRGAFPDISHSIANAVASDYGVGAEIVALGTNTGPLISHDGEVPPTGKEVTFRAAQIATIRDGVISMHHIYYDQLDIMTQLGFA